MLGIDLRALRIAWTVFLFVGVVVVAYLIRATLVEFAIAIFFSYLLGPVVDLVERFLPGRRNISLALVYVVILALLITAGVNLGSRIAEQAASLAARLPAMLQNPHIPQVPLPDWAAPYKDKVYEAVRQQASVLSEGAVPLLQKAGGQLLSGIGSIIPVILVPILAFFLLKDARVIRDALIGLFDDNSDRVMVREVVDDIHNVLSRYIRALATLALASFTAWFLFLQILGTPYQLLLGGIAGVLEFIPVIGPALATIIVVIVAIATGSGGVVWILVFWICFRMFQDYVLSPFLMSSGVELHPLLILFGILAGAKIGGIGGMFFAVPMIAILKVIYVRVRRLQRERRKAHIVP